MKKMEKIEKVIPSIVVGDWQSIPLGCGMEIGFFDGNELVVCEVVDSDEGDRMVLADPRDAERYELDVLDEIGQDWFFIT
jgi:hypothetical protein